YVKRIVEMHRKYQWLRSSFLRRKPPALLPHDARRHIVELKRQRVNELNNGTLPHPKCSPDLSPVDYHLFRRATTSFTRNASETKQRPKRFQRFHGSRGPKFFATGIIKCVSRWRKCI
ncbi:hypothetical protein Angca_003612, partial [Angiostrongylus cantonensis]